MAEGPQEGFKLREQVRKAEERIEAFHAEYKELVQKYEQDLKKEREYFYANDEDGYTAVAELEEKLKEMRTEMEQRIAKTLADIFGKFAKVAWEEHVEAPGVDETKIRIFHLPLGHLYRLRMFYALAHPKRRGRKTYNEEAWNLSVEERNVGANENTPPAGTEEQESSAAWPLSFRLNFGTDADRPEVYDVRPTGAMDDVLPRTRFEKAIQDFKRKHRL